MILHTSDHTSPSERALPLRAQVLELRGLVSARRAIEETIKQKAQTMLDQGADRSQVAAALGISRAQLYRVFRLCRDEEGRQGRPRGGVANP